MVGGGWCFEAVYKPGIVAVAAVAAVMGVQLRKNVGSQQQLEKKGCAVEVSLLDMKSCD